MTGQLLRAWVWLVALSAATTLVAVFDLAYPYAGVLILFAAWAKSRIIFLWYLGLAPVQGWREGILTGLALFLTVLFALYLLT